VCSSDLELGLYSAGTTAWFDQNVPMGGRALVQYGAPNGSPTQILHVNNLGTTTVTTDQTGAELQDELFYPWGRIGPAPGFNTSRTLRARSMRAPNISTPRSSENITLPWATG